jgi:beta-glucosidase
MKSKICFLIALAMYCTSANLMSQTGNAPQLGKDPVNRVVAAMTLEEKASFVVGTGMHIPGMQSAGPVVGQTQDLVPGAAGTTLAIPRLGIPAIVVADGPAGLRISPSRENDKNTYYCTAFPVASLLASSWDAALLGKVGQAMGSEVLEYGVDIILGPGMNIHRNPLAGRNFEYFSEDPLLSGKMAAAIVNGIESKGVGTSIKHFAANNAETNRNALNTIVSERALREIYLKGFEIAVKEAQPWTVMSSYNLINDVYAPENPDLLINVLRNDWGFKGFVMTDWFGGNDAVAMMKAHNDLLMPGRPDQTTAIIEAVKQGQLDVKILDRNITDILNIILQSPHFKGYKFSNRPDLKTNAEIARQASAEGMVLLKNNEGTLPFDEKINSVAAFGNTSYDIISGGTGSGDVNEAYTVSLVEGLANNGFTVNEKLRDLYTGYLELSKAGIPKVKGLMALMAGFKAIDELSVNQDIIKGLADESDAAIITIGRNSGEGRDREDKEGDFRLTQYEHQLIRDVSEAFKAKNKKTVVILNIGGVVETASWKDLPDAILLAWQGGQETGNSIAEILRGKVNPSGKIAVTFPVNYQDVPSSKTFPGRELPERKAGPDSPVNSFMRVKPSIVYYEEGIYVGYRYYETFGVKPSYEFGYGLSYTDFEYSNLRLSSSKFSNSISVTIDIKNTGKLPGKEIVQLYVSAPSGKLDKPAEELKGFAKTQMLQPGAMQTLSFTIDKNSISSFDPETSSWIAEAGNYEVRVSASSKDIRQKASFSLQKTISIKKESKSLAPKDKINELRNEKQIGNF